MNRQPLKDKFGRIYGYLDIDSNGIVYAKDESGRIIAVYNPATNATTDYASGRILGYGNTAAAYVVNKN